MNQNAVIDIYFFLFSVAQTTVMMRKPYPRTMRTPTVTARTVTPPSTLCPEDEEDLASYLTKTELFS